MEGSLGDEMLLVGVAERDIGAFRALYERHAGWLARRCNDRDLVADAIQDAFVAVWQRPRRSPSTSRPARSSTSHPPDPSAAPVLYQVAQHDGMPSADKVGKVIPRAPRAEVQRYPMDHFGLFRPEHQPAVATDASDFLRIRPDAVAHSLPGRK
jgi:hypothetical protein